MIRLQRKLLRSGAASVVAGCPGDASFRDLILTADLGAIAAGAGACVESGVAAGETSAARTGGLASGLGTIAGEAGESATVFSDVDGTTACFGVVGDTAGSLVARGSPDPLGSASFVTTKTDAMPSATTATTGSNDLRAISTTRLGLAGESVATAPVGSLFALTDTGRLAWVSATS